MKKVLSPKHTLISTQHYPWRIHPSTRTPISHRHKAIIGIGGNIGDVSRRFEHLFWFLKRSNSVTIIETTPLLQNPPFGFINQNDFHNALLLIHTSLTPKKLLMYLLHVEKKFGRKRSMPNAPRTLDLDIIFYNNIKIDSKELTIPHPQWIYRDSVLIPLSLMKGQS